MSNAGGEVTEATIRDIAKARRSLGVGRVVVVQHRPCAFLESPALPAAHAPDAADRLRASLSRFVDPPLWLPHGAVRGVLVDAGGGVTHVTPP